ncbi:MAG: NAD(P)/FAD-dependent oxidoreductase [Puniceicoccales bacterium]|jgi:phytoene dehydrogenase-like protein|nr:NAD(P)/FAD-dependent oxidoreductase [Puniceicoccales bacterium]
MSDLHGKHYDTLIIGAGMSGLAAGIRLAHYGKNVLILERHTLPGGLNSYYMRGGRCHDTGLHALTNATPAGAKGTPLAKILRQLRLRHEALELAPQRHSAIHFAGKRIAFTNNNFAGFEARLADAYPRQADALRRLDTALRAYPDTALDAPPGSARAFLAEHLGDPELIDLLLLPLFYYGSARPNDMDLPQLAIMWKSLFHEGFARPREGVRQILRLLLEKYHAAGGTRKMGTGVRRLHTDAQRVTAAELDNGEILTATTVLSSAGLAETHRLCGAPADATATPGALSFCETITLLDQRPREDFHWQETILFYCDSDRLRYESPDALVDPRSGVICIPNNYAYAPPHSLDKGWLRVTALASHAHWKALSPDAYAAAKHEWHAKLNATARAHLPPVPDARFDAAIAARDMFTPLTIERYTGHINGAIYGAPLKRRDGRTHWENLFLCGTDQGFLGITGALLSGISMANLHILKTD